MPRESPRATQIVAITDELEFLNRKFQEARWESVRESAKQIVELIETMPRYQEEETDDSLRSSPAPGLP